MSSAERPAQRQPSRNGDPEHTDSPESVPHVHDAQPAKAAASRPVGVPSMPAGPRVWVLPTAAGDWWALPESASELEAKLANTAPVLLSPQVDGEASADVARHGRERILYAFNARFHDRLIAFMGRALLCVGLMAVSLVGLRLPGWFRELDSILLLGSLGFLVYSFARHGMAAVSLHNQRVDATQAVGRSTWAHSPLAERLSKALHLRHTLPASERGKSPDDELLDTGAYRKLIQDGVTTTDELCKLGQAIDSELQFSGPHEEKRSIKDVAQANGLDVETVLFYRDLAAAAAEINLDQQLAQAIRDNA